MNPSSRFDPDPIVNCVDLTSLLPTKYLRLEILGSG